MFEIARFETERGLTETAVLAVGLSAFAGMMLLIAPSVLDSFDVAALTESFPPALVEAMQLDVLATIEGFMALELYWFGWLLVLGVYLAYTAAGTIAGSIDDGTMDTLLAAPLSRRQVLAETYLALAVPILLVNLVVFGVVAIGTRAVGEPIALADLFAVHALSVPYLLFWAAFGLTASVLATRRTIAEGVAAGTVSATFLIETVADGAGLDWLGLLSPTRYYDPVAILTTGAYNYAGAALLLVGAAVLLTIAAWTFARRDI